MVGKDARNSVKTIVYVDSQLSLEACTRFWSFETGLKLQGTADEKELFESGCMPLKQS